MIKKFLKIYPYMPGGFGTSIATALEGNVRLEVNPPIPATVLSRAAGNRSIRFPQAITRSSK